MDDPHPDALRLQRPDLRWRESYLSLLNEFAARGERCHQHYRPLAEGDFAALLARWDDLRTGRGVEAEMAPQSHFWLIRDGAEIVATARLRHWLTEHFYRAGGHIGYDVRPSCRGRGLATRLLRLMLDQARGRGLVRALLTCDDDNHASARVIEKCGGILQDTVYSPRHRRPHRRYWIELA